MERVQEREQNRLTVGCGMNTGEIQNIYRKVTKWMQNGQMIENKGKHSLECLLESQLKMLFSALLWVTLSGTYPSHLCCCSKAVHFLKVSSHYKVHMKWKLFCLIWSSNTLVKWLQTFKFSKTKFNRDFSTAKWCIFSKKWHRILSTTLCHQPAWHNF